MQCRFAGCDKAAAYRCPYIETKGDCTEHFLDLHRNIANPNDYLLTTTDTETAKDDDMTITANQPTTAGPLPMGALVASEASFTMGVVVEHGYGFSKVWKADSTGVLLYNNENHGWRVVANEDNWTSAEKQLVTAITQSHLNHKAMNEARDRATVAAKELATFKDRVREVAMAAAIENDMCEEVAKALDALGLDSTMTIRVTGTFTVDMQIPMHGRDLYDSVSESDIEQHIADGGYVDISIDSIERETDGGY